MSESPKLTRLPPQLGETTQWTQSAKLCPVCKDQNLWSFDGESKSLMACTTCGGVATTVEILQKASGRSLFSESMFVFRPSDGRSICHFCGEWQASRNKSCQKCGHEIFRIRCTGCSGQMSEYVLKDLVIDRCQICNAVWLDNEEFEKVMNATPDLRRRYDEAVRKREQMRMEALATSHSHRLSLAEKDPEDGSALGDLICFLLFDD